jgi:hypothetical protein
MTTLKGNGMFVQKMWKIWNEISQSSPMISLQNLENRSFIKESEEGRFMMHD